MQLPHHEQSPVRGDQSLRVLIWDHDLVDMWSLDGAGRRTPFIGKGSTWHVHPDLELTLITGGSGILAVGDHLGRFSAPDAILIGAGVPHVWIADAALAGVSIQFRLEGSSPLRALPECTGLARLWSRAHLGLRWRGAALATIAEQTARLEGTPSLGRLARFLAIVTVLGETEATEAVTLSDSVVSSDQSGRHGAALARVVDHLLTHFREELRLADLVRVSGLSQATFCRHFLATTGRTFTAFLNAIRLQEVRRALLDTTLDITAIAFAAGFNNLSHFNAIFRRSAGCSPRDFRRQGLRGGPGDPPAG